MSRILECARLLDDAARNARVDDDGRRVAEDHRRRAHGRVHFAHAAFCGDNVRAVQLARVERNAAQRFRFMVCQRRGDARDLNLHRSDNTDHVRNPLFRGCFQSAPIIPHKTRAVDFHLLRVPIILLFICCFYLKRLPSFSFIKVRNASASPCLKPSLRIKYVLPSPKYI